MLVLQRKIGEAINVGGDVRITIVDVRGSYVRVGIDAPREVPVHRQEVTDAIRRERGEA
jgi:carbon storage regulator